MKIKMQDSISIDIMGETLVKLGYYKRRIQFNKKRKNKYMAVISEEFHKFKNKESDKE